MIRDAIRDAAGDTGGVARGLRVVGAGTWIDAGRPVAAEHRISTCTLRGVVEYEPGDLTLTARAGTTLAEIAETTAPERQWLALDPAGSPAGTIGATVATASAGPLSHAFGLPRDTVLGVEVVTGDGQIVRGGGRVVKNVAGFDLARLFVGSWGSLGVITEVTVRLRALPDVDETVAIPATVASTALATVARAPVLPIALELISRALAARLGLGADPLLLVRLAGNADSVATQRRALGDAVRPIPTSVWSALREAEPAGAPVWRASTRPSLFESLWAMVPPDAEAHATPRRGVVRFLGVDPSTMLALRDHATIIGERLPPDAWRALGGGPAADHLSTGIRQAFDPARVLNPGILG
jgi:glycolate oxidase FAD binding subunit